MNEFYKNAILKGLIGLCAAFLVACSAVDIYEPGSGLSDVVLRVTDGSTRTSVNPDGLTVSWEKGDRIAVWAEKEDGSWQFAGQPFDLMAFDGNFAAFTSTLSEQMPDVDYNYYAAYPVPIVINGTKLTFNIPSVQDGKASGGSDIMIARPVSGGPLGTVADIEESPVIAFKHLVHLLKFYLPEDSNGLDGEQVTEIRATLPSAVCGKMTVDLTDSEYKEINSGSNEIVIRLADALEPSVTSRNYACATIMPKVYDSGDVMQVKLLSNNKIAKINIPLEGRSFVAGHATPVALHVDQVNDISTLVFSIATNNLGESVQKITVEAPDGCVLGEIGSNIYEYAPDGDISVGDSFRFMFEDRSQFEGLAGQTIKVTYESEHAITHQNVTVPSLVSVKSAQIALTVPYLLYEDFSGVGSFSSDDEHSGSSTGSKGAYSFLDGWTAGRAGAQAGKCIRIAPRVEIGMYIGSTYDARADSAPIAEIKKSAKVKVEFDYGYNNAFISKADFGAIFRLGYVTDSNAYKSGDTTGVFEDEFNTSGYPKDADWTTPHHKSFVIENMPTGETNRISWCGSVQWSKQFAGNTTCWLYIDNIKVSISK